MKNIPDKILLKHFEKFENDECVSKKEIIKYYGSLANFISIMEELNYYVERERGCTKKEFKKMIEEIRQVGKNEERKRKDREEIKERAIEGFKIFPDSTFMKCKIDHYDGVKVVCELYN
jgi:hypothetical protein